MVIGLSLLVSVFTKELEVALDGERRAAEDARGAAVISERKRIAVQTELEDVRALLESVGALILFRHCTNCRRLKKFGVPSCYWIFIQHYL